MPLLHPDEITVEALSADLPMQRSHQNQLRLQLLTLAEGLELDQNPLERGQKIREHQVSAGETLQIISVRLFGVPDHWRSLADVNRLPYPHTVYPGQILVVPEI
jgi:nucleoid-associated protein YgaU